MSRHETNSGQRGSADRIMQSELEYGPVNASIVQAGNLCKRHRCYQNMLEDCCNEVLFTPKEHRHRVFAGSALFVGQLVVADELEDNWARWWLECTAVVGEMHNFNCIIDSAFLAAQRDFEKHYGAGFRHG